MAETREVACCSHLTVLYQTEEMKSGGVRGWWACKDCGHKFWPAEAASPAVSQPEKCPRCEIEAQDFEGNPRGMRNWIKFDWGWRIPCNHPWHSSAPAVNTSPGDKSGNSGVPSQGQREEAVGGGADRIKLEVFQHDWIPGFASFHEDGSIQEGAVAHVALNLGTLLSCVDCGDLPKSDLPYMIAECLMHEAIHALESWARVEFSEDRVEALLESYRKKYRPIDETHWQYERATETGKAETKGR
jgi:hypothetical protein